MASRVVQSILSWLVVYKRTLKSRHCRTRSPCHGDGQIETKWKCIHFFGYTSNEYDISYLFVTCNHARRDKLPFIYRHDFVIFN